MPPCCRRAPVDRDRDREWGRIRDRGADPERDSPDGSTKWRPTGGRSEVGGRSEGGGWRAREIARQESWKKQ